MLTAYIYNYPFSKAYTTEYYWQAFSIDYGDLPINSYESKLRYKIRNMSRINKLFYLEALKQESTSWMDIGTISKLLKEVIDGPVQTSYTYRPLIGRSRTLFSSGLERARNINKKGWSTIPEPDSIKPCDTQRNYQDIGRGPKSRTKGPFSMV